MKTPEKKLSEKFSRFAAKKGWLILKLQLIAEGGFPDVMVVMPGGRIFFIEFKKPSKKSAARMLESRQVVVGEKLRSLGATVYTLNSWEDILEVVQHEDGI